MARSRRQLIDAVLDNLGILVPGQSPGDEAVSRVDDHIDPALATLAALDIVYVGDAGQTSPPTGGQIEDAVFLPISDWITFAVAGGFNRGDDPALKVLADQAEQTLRTIGRPARTRKVLTADTQLQGYHHSVIGNFTRGT